MITNKPNRQNVRKLSLGRGLYKPYGLQGASPPPPSGATVTGSVDTDTVSDGTLYTLMDTSAVDPAAGDVKSTGQVIQAVSGVTTQNVTVPADSFPADTYYLHFVQETTEGFSNVITSPPFPLPNPAPGDPPIASGTFIPPNGNVDSAYIYETAPLFTGGAVVSYSLNGTLPAGLIFGTDDGRITGTPTTEETSVSLSVTGTNDDGSDATNTDTLTIDAALSPGGLVASIVASQIAGRSPLGVVFSCDKTTATNYDSHEVWRQFGYYFDFDDPTSGTYNTARGGSKNVHIGGPICAHTFIVPDGGGIVNFDVLVNIEAPDGSVGQASVTITVEAQDSFHAPADTILVSNTLNVLTDWSTLGFDKSPPSLASGAIQQATMPAWNSLTGKRVMILRGDDFTAATYQIGYGTFDFAITDFGDVVSGPALFNEFHVGTQSDAALDSNTTDAEYFANGSKWIETGSIENIKPWAIRSGMSMTHVTLHNLDMDFEASGNSQAGRMSLNRRATTCYDPSFDLSPSNVLFTNGTYISDCTLIGGGNPPDFGNQIYMPGGAANMAVYGCTIRRSDEHNIRIEGMYKGVVHDSDILGEHIGGAGAKHRVTNRGSGFQDAGDTSGQNRGLTTGIVVIFNGANETDYMGGTKQGIFDGGAGHNVGDVITITKGATLVVNAEVGNVVTEFTVSSATDTGGHEAFDQLDQIGTTGTGTGFFLTVDTSNFGKNENMPQDRYFSVDNCTLSASDLPESSWGVQFAPAADTILSLIDDQLARNIVFEESTQQPPNEIAFGGRYQSAVLPMVYNGSGVTDTGPQQDMNRTIPLEPNYINSPAVPVPASPR